MRRVEIAAPEIALRLATSSAWCFFFVSFVKQQSVWATWKFSSITLTKKNDNGWCTVSMSVSKNRRWKLAYHGLNVFQRRKIENSRKSRVTDFRLLCGAFILRSCNPIKHQGTTYWLNTQQQPCQRNNCALELWSAQSFRVSNERVANNNFVVVLFPSCSLSK